MSEMIEESGGGFVYNTDEELVKAMDNLVMNPSLRRESGLKGYDAYQRNWTTEEHLSRYFALIHQIASTHGHGGIGD